MKNIFCVICENEFFYLGWDGSSICTNCFTKIKRLYTEANYLYVNIFDQTLKEYKGWDICYF